MNAKAAHVARPGPGMSTYEICAFTWSLTGQSSGSKSNMRALPRVMALCSGAPDVTIATPEGGCFRIVLGGYGAAVVKIATGSQRRECSSKEQRR